MSRRIMRTLGRIVERMANLSPPRHRELVRGMVSELDSIADSAERTSFAVGAIAAITRLALSACALTAAHALGRIVGVWRPEAGADLGRRTMSKLTVRQVLRRHATPFAVSAASLTLLLLARHAMRYVPTLIDRGLPADAIVEVVLLAIPHTLALTIPMAVFVAVSWVFTRLGAEGVLASASRERNGVPRLVAPVLCVAAVIGMLIFVSNTQVLPRANAQLATALRGAPLEPTDRTMTIGELRDAARTARLSTGDDGAVRAAAYEVEIQKKFALAAAIVVLALAGAATAIRFPRGGIRLVIGASGFVFTGYYLALAAGEALADGQVVSPFVAMWMANALLLAFVLLLLWRPSGPSLATGAETLAIGG